jgi:hypothetical protein
MPPLGLMTVAALLPRDWTVRLVDRKVQAFRRADIAWADVIMVGGMIVQRPDALEVMSLCQRLGKPVVRGGPDATCWPSCRPSTTSATAAMSPLRLVGHLPPASVAASLTRQVSDNP